VPNLIPDLGPDLILDLGPDLILDLGPDLILDLGPDLILDLGPDLILDLGPDVIELLESSENVMSDVVELFWVVSSAESVETDVEPAESPEYVVVESLVVEASAAVSDDAE